MSTLAHDLHVLVRRMDREADRRLAALGTSYSRYVVLLVTGEQPGLTQRDLAEAIGVSEPATSRTVAALVAGGAMASERVPGTGNRRALHLTDAGRRLVDDASAVLGSSFDDLARSLGIDPEAMAADVRRLAETVEEG